MSTRPHLLLVAPDASYRTAPFLRAAESLGVDVLLLASGGRFTAPTHTSGRVFDPALPHLAEQRVAEEARKRPFDGVCGTDDSTVEIAARIGERLGLPVNPPGAVALTRNKLLSRRRLQQAGIPGPAIAHLPHGQAPAALEQVPDYPVVVKPLALSASRGVIRVESPPQLEAAVDRVERLLAREGAQNRDILIETYIPGFEVAVEAMLVNGTLHPLAVFDKPTPLTGPYFEETYYVTPSRLPAFRQRAMMDLLSRICRVLELRHGPIHAEFRFNEHGIWPVEVAARTIGGRCARLLTVGSSQTLEELVILQALGRAPSLEPKRGASGVLMLPVPGSGVVRRTEGIGEARAVDGITGVEVDVSSGQVLTAWPEGGAYPGFVFSSGPTPLDAERALREAAARLRIVVAPILAGGSLGAAESW